MDNDGYLNVTDVAHMMEKLGETKTISEVKAMIAEVDHDKDGKVSFVEFLQMLTGPQKEEGHAGGAQSSFGRIYNSGLKSHANFFEQSAAGTRDKTQDNKAVIQKAYEEKKKIAALRKEEQEKERLEAEADEKKKLESKNRLAAKAAMFEKGA